MNRFRVLTLLALTVLMSCYHITVISGAPAGPKTIEEEWQHSFIFGIVPADSISTKSACPLGIAKFETGRSFMNGVASTVTLNIYTPTKTTITCASGPVRR